MNGHEQERRGFLHLDHTRFHRGSEVRLNMTLTELYTRISIGATEQGPFFARLHPKGHLGLVAIDIQQVNGWLTLNIVAGDPDAWTSNSLAQRTLSTHR